jgi:hypothetical protein
MNTNSPSSAFGASIISSDRRTSSRHGVDLLLNRFVNGYPYLCRATDISRGGMRIVPLNQPAQATRFMGLQFQLPGSDDVVTASGEMTVASSDGSVGVRFTRLPESSLEQIGRFLARAESHLS